MRYSTGALSIALSFFHAALAVAEPPPDPWAPGASMAPWDVIDRLQALSRVSPHSPWPELHHPDPLVRAAAAWAVGRLQPSGAGARLAPLIDDDSALVRHAALWGLLRLDGPEAGAGLRRALGSWKKLSHVGYGTPIHFPAEPMRGFAWWQRLPFGLRDASLAERRHWLLRVPAAGERKPPLSDRGEQVEIEEAALRLPRSQWDADERVLLEATLTASGGTRAAAPDLNGRLFAWDDVPPHGSRTSWRTLDVALAAARPDETLSVAPCTTAARDLILRVHELTPGVYVLKALASANPVLIRVRRTKRREAELQRAAVSAASPEELERVARLRLVAAAPALRERLRGALAAKRPSEEAYALGRALARLGDAESAYLLIRALSEAQYLPSLDGHTLNAVHPIVLGFGPLALPALEQAAQPWRSKLGPNVGGFLVSLLSSSYWISPELDATRLDVVSSLSPSDEMISTGHSINLGDPRNQEREIWLGSLAALAPRQPQETGEALAAAADRRVLFVTALDAIEKSVDGATFERVLRAAWPRLAAVPAQDAASAIVAAAERLGVSLPEPRAIAPATAKEAVRQLWATSWPRVPPSARWALVHRIEASSLWEKDAALARVLAQTALAAGDAPLAVRATDRALELSADGIDRGFALRVRGRLRAAEGALDEARADLTAALPHLAKDAKAVAEARAALARMERVPPAAGLRVRLLDAVPERGSTSYPRRSGSARVAWLDHDSGDLLVRDLATGQTASLALPLPALATELLPDGRAAMISTARTLEMLGPDRSPQWAVDLGPDFKDVWWQAPQLHAAQGCLIAAHRAGLLRAYDADDGKPLWSRRVAAEASLAAVDSGVWLITEEERERKPDKPSHGKARVTSIESDRPPPRWVARFLDARTGHTRLTQELPERPSAWAALDSGLAWIDYPGRVSMVDRRTGHVRWTTAIGQRPYVSGEAWPKIVSSDEPPRVYVARGPELIALDGTSGAPLWTRTFAASPLPPETQRDETGAPVIRDVWVAVGREVWWMAEPHVASGQSDSWRRSISAWTPDGHKKAERLLDGYKRYDPLLVDADTLAIDHDGHLQLWSTRGSVDQEIQVPR